MPSSAFHPGRNFKRLENALCSMLKRMLNVFLLIICASFFQFCHYTQKKDNLLEISGTTIYGKYITISYKKNCSINQTIILHKFGDHSKHACIALIIYSWYSTIKREKRWNVQIPKWYGQLNHQQKNRHNFYITVICNKDVFSFYDSMICHSVCLTVLMTTAFLYVDWSVVSNEYSYGYCFQFEHFPLYTSFI